MFNTKKNEVEFPAAKTLLSIIHKEYEYELQRKSAVETRSGIFITLLVAFFTFTISNIDFTKLIFFQELTSIKLVQIIISIILIISSVLSWIASISYFIRVLIIYKYERIALGDFTQEFAGYKEDIICISFVEAYREVVEKNQKVNDEKVNHYVRGIYFLIPFISSVILLFMISIII